MLTDHNYIATNLYPNITIHTYRSGSNALILSQDVQLETPDLFPLTDFRLQAVADFLLALR